MTLCQMRTQVPFAKKGAQQPPPTFRPMSISHIINACYVYLLAILAASARNNLIHYDTSSEIVLAVTPEYGFSNTLTNDKQHVKCQLPLITRHRASTSMYSLTFLHLRYVARTPAVEARSPGRRSNVENEPHRCQASHAHFPYTPRNFENTPRHLPVTGRQHVQTPPSVRTVVIPRDGRKLVTRAHVMLP